MRKEHLHQWGTTIRVLRLAHHEVIQLRAQNTKEPGIRLAHVSIILISMRGFSSDRQGRSQGRFVLVNGMTKEEVPVRWDWLTQRQRKEEETEDVPRLSYSEKKSILTDLHDRQRATTSFKIRDGFSRKEKTRAVSTAACSSSKTQRRNSQPFVYLNSNEDQLSIPNLAFSALREELVRRLVDAQLNGRKILTVLSAKRNGLRYKLYHAFVEYCSCSKSGHSHQLKDISDQLKRQSREFSKQEKELYYFYIDRAPVHNYQELGSSKPCVVLVDWLPKLNFSKAVMLRVVQQAEKIEQIFEVSDGMRSRANYSKIRQQIEEEEELIYDWQRIASVKEYVDRISDNPTERLAARPAAKSQLAGWYNERFKQDDSSAAKPSQNDKNPLFQSKTHYPSQIINKRLLSTAREKVQSLATTANRHKFVPQRLDIMMEQLRRETIAQQSSQPKVKNSFMDAAVSKRDLLQQLDRKNSLLSTQNIPYLIEKYGLNRFEIYNLYNLYKSFEKVSLLRHARTASLQEVLDKGVDRETFEVGLKGLDMNPGEQLIKNICYFGDFISWEQFIKIISISLRKTPEEKLTAILKGISSFDDGFLTRHQISLMIGNSLQKLFDKEEGELREYFTEMAMRELDSERAGKVSVERMKERILGKGSNNLTMVAFLILNT